jgi:hypothetical protein
MSKDPETVFRQRGPADRNTHRGGASLARRIEVSAQARRAKSGVMTTSISVVTAISVQVSLVRLPIVQNTTTASACSEAQYCSSARTALKVKTSAVRQRKHFHVDNLDAALVQQVLYVSKRQRKQDVVHHSHPDDSGARVEDRQPESAWSSGVASRASHSSQAKFL